MECLYVLFDPRCGLCRWARRWMESQEAYVPVVFVEAGSGAAVRMFPGVSKPGEPEELVVVSDEGHVYRGDAAWIMCLYALVDYREWSLRLASPALRPFARRAFALISKRRQQLSLLLGLSDDQTADVLGRVIVAPCELDPAASRLQQNTELHAGSETRGS
jgi:predicted DCC family thiol-disulfide oxidoreductase YuxK